MAAFIVTVFLAFGTSILVYRQTRQNFSVTFLVIFLALVSLTEKRVQKTNEKFFQMQSALQDE
jgi:hypothetical protein